MSECIGPIPGVKASLTLIVFIYIWSDVNYVGPSFRENRMTRASYVASGTLSAPPLLQQFLNVRQGTGPVAMACGVASVPYISPIHAL